MLKVKTLVLPLLIALVILPRVSLDLYLPSLPYLGQALHADDFLLQMTLTIFMLGYALSMLISGVLSDVLGRKPVLIGGLTLFLLATAVCAITSSITVFIIARFFQALGGCCGTTVTRVMVKEAYHQDHQMKILSHLSAAMAMCPLIIPVLGGALQMYGGWRTIFYLLGMFALVLLILTQRYIDEPSVIRQPISWRGLLGHYKTLLSHRLFWGYSMAISFAWCNYFSFTLVSPFLLQKTLQFNSVTFGLLFGITVIGYLIGTQITRRWANQVGWDNLILMAAWLCVLAAFSLTLLVLLFSLNWEMIVFPMAIVLIGVGIIIPCTQGAVMQPFPHIVGTAAGLFYFIQMLFGAGCGLILQAFSYDSALPMAITILISSVLLLVSFYQLIWIGKN